MSAKIKYPVVNGLKECGDCHQWKPIEQFNKARNHYTSRCHDCLSLYAQRYRNRPDVKIKTRKYHQEYIKNPLNRENKNRYLSQYRKQPHVKIKKNAARRKWTETEKLKAIKYKGGKCEVCGYSKCTAALDFHHKNPLTKNGYGTGALKQHWTFERNKSEIDKCILVCVRCHREIHAGVI